MSGSNSQEKTIDCFPLFRSNLQVIKNGESVPKVDTKKVHSETLDDLVNINCLFTVAVFVGLAYATRGQQSLENRVECQAGTGVGKMLVVYEVLAFACFVFSSLVAKVIKLFLSLDVLEVCGISFRKPGLDVKDALLIVAAIASAFGIVLLTLSVINIVQIRVGMFSCGTLETKVAVLGLCSIVAVALVIYVVSIVIAVCASIKSDRAKNSSIEKV